MLLSATITPSRYASSSSSSFSSELPPRAAEAKFFFFFAFFLFEAFAGRELRLSSRD